MKNNNEQLPATGQRLTKSLMSPKPPRMALSSTTVIAIAIIVDVAAIIAPGIMVLVIAGGINVTDAGAAVNALAAYLALLLLSFKASGLYEFDVVMQPRKRMLTMVGVCGLIAGGLIVTALTMGVANQYSGAASILWLLGAAGSIVALRLALARSVRALAVRGKVGRSVVIYGAGAPGQRLLAHLSRRDEPWLRVAGVFDDRFARPTEDYRHTPLLGDLDDLIEWSRIHRVDDVIIALPWIARGRILRLIDRLAVVKTNVCISTEFVELHPTQRSASEAFGVPVFGVLERSEPERNEELNHVR